MTTSGACEAAPRANLPTLLRLRSAPYAGAVTRTVSPRECLREIIGRLQSVEHRGKPSVEHAIEHDHAISHGGNSSIVVGIATEQVALWV